MIHTNVSKEKMSLGLTAFDLLTSIKLPHIQCGGPDGAVDITPDYSMRGDAGSNPARDTNFSFISETCVESHWLVIYIFLSLF